jgi:hypothetical protein
VVVDDLHGVPILHRERRSQDGVTVDEMLKRLPQKLGIQFSPETCGVGEIVRRALGNKLLDEPEGTLPLRQGEPCGCIRCLT